MDASVTLGLDARQLKSELIAAEKVFQGSVNRMAQNAEKSGFRRFFKSDRRVERGFEALPAQLASVQNGYEAVGVAAEAASRVLRLPLGVGVGIATLVFGLGKAREKFLEMKQATADARSEASKPFAGGSLELLKQQADDADKQIKKLQASRTASAVAFDTLTQGHIILAKGNTRVEGPETENSLAAEAELASKKFAISAEIAKGAKEEAAANRILLTEDERRGELAKNELATRQKIAAIDANENLYPDAKVELKRQATSDGAIAHDKINQKYYEQQAQLISLAAAANFRGTKEAELVHTLDAQLAAARRFEKTAQTTLEVEEARVRVAQALKAIHENNVANALAGYARTAARENSNNGRRTAVANVNATPEQAERNDLQLEVDNSQSNFRAAQRSYLRKPDKDSAAAQTEAYNEVLSAKAKLARFNKETAFANRQELAAAKATTGEMELQLAGYDHLARLARIRADYADKIARYERLGRKDLANEARTQLKIAERKEGLGEFEKDANEYGGYSYNFAAHQAERNQQQRARAFGAIQDDKEKGQSRGAVDHADQRNGVPYVSQLDQPRRSSIESGATPLSTADWNDQFKRRLDFSAGPKAPTNIADQVKDGVQNPAQNGDAGSKLDSAADKLSAAADKLEKIGTNQ